MAMTRNHRTGAGAVISPPSVGSFLLKVLKWLGIVLGVLILALVLFFLWFDLNMLRGPISRYVSSELHRPFAINGDLQVDWSWTPKLSIGGVELGNAVWGSRREMAGLDRGEVSVRIPELFKGHLVVPEIRLVKPRVFLERDAGGRANWKFDLAPKPEGESFQLPRRWFPKIERLTVDDGRFGLHDAVSGSDLDLKLSTAMGASNEQAVKLTGNGRLQKERFTVAAKGGSILKLWEEGQPFPVELRVDYGATHAEVAGSFAEPLQLQGPALRFEAEGPDLAALRPFTRAWIPVTPPYRFAGRIARKGDAWLLNGFEGRLGGSDLRGNLVFTLKGERPTLDGDVESNKLDFRDFAGFIGADPRPDAPPRPRLLPDEPYDVAGLRVADADIRFRSGNIVTPMMPVDEVTAHVRLDHGVLSVKPADATVGLGRIRTDLTLDATGNLIKTRLDSRIERVPFQRLLAKTRFAPKTSGTFLGRVKLAMTGNSVARMAATSDGGVTVLMESGRISELIMELIGLDIAEVLFRFVANKDRSMAVQCLVTDFIVTDGVMKNRLFLLDTTDTKVTGDGRIDLRDETLRFRLAAHPKDPSIFSARTPVIIDGTLKHPSGRPEAAPLIARGAASIVLGALLTPAAALLPWVELGVEQDSPCRALVDAAKQEGEIGGRKKGKRR